MIRDNIDIYLVSKTKLDNTFPVSQFYTDSYSTPYHLDRTSHGGGILLYIREDIPTKMIKFEPVQNSFECFFVEINLRKKKWLLSCSYNPNKYNFVNHIINKTTGFDQFSATYDNIIVTGDFNVEPQEDNMSGFLNIYNLKNLVKLKTCYKNPDHPSCIDLILTNFNKSFQSNTVFGT